CLNPVFASLEWSPNERFLLYIAEKKEAKKRSFFTENEITDNSQPAITPGTEFLYKDDWGEDLDGFAHPCVYIVDVESNFTIRAIEIDDMSLGQAFWINEHSIGFIAWKEAPYRLGLSYCSDRETFLYSQNLSKPNLEPKLLYGNEVKQGIRFPRMSPDGNFVIFLSSPLAFNYESCRLMKYTFENQTSEIIVDVESSNEQFYPLYVPNGLAANCFVGKNRIILDCIHNCQSVLELIDLNTKERFALNFPLSCSRILDVKNNIIAILCSAPDAYPTVYLAKLDHNSKQLQYNKVNDAVNEQISDLRFKCDQIEIEEGNLKINLHTILISPTSQVNKSSPTIVYSHGGPHSSFNRGYLLEAHFFAKCGFKVLLTNYRGSTGINEECVRSIRGSIGDGDIRDLLTCIQHHDEKGDIDKSKLLLYGWSHSGFQMLHLCGQYPDFGFKACAVSNPVTDVCTIGEVTDTPDWCWVKSFGGEKAFSLKNVVDAEVLKSFFDKSPMKFVHQNNTPTLFLLGRLDRRCPLSQGLKYYKAMKACGVNVKCCVYNDNHLLSKVEVKSDVLMNIIAWFIQHMQ
ncbi:acylamino-acid-releasing enzyme-like isoform X2, partial [Leptotrombidium deliense]